MLPWDTFCHLSEVADTQFCEHGDNQENLEWDDDKGNVFHIFFVLWYPYCCKALAQLDAFLALVRFLISVLLIILNVKTLGYRSGMQNGLIVQINGKFLREKERNLLWTVSELHLLLKMYSQTHKVVGRQT